MVGREMCSQPRLMVTSVAGALGQKEDGVGVAVCVGCGCLCSTPAPYATSGAGAGAGRGQTVPTFTQLRSKCGAQHCVPEVMKKHQRQMGDGMLRHWGKKRLLLPGGTGVAVRVTVGGGSSDMMHRSPGRNVLP